MKTLTKPVKHPEEKIKGVICQKRTLQELGGNNDGRNENTSLKMYRQE